MEQFFQMRTVAPATRAHNRSHYENHFGGIRRTYLTQLTVPVCRRWLNDLEESLREKNPPLGSRTRSGTLTSS
jgi:hypothetical protein